MPRRSRDYTTEPKHEVESTVPPHAPASAPTGHGHHALHLPRYNHNGHKVTTGIHPDGESGRRGFNPWLFLKICARSSCFASRMVNFLWPVVPAAIAVHFARPEWHVTIFILNYIAMVPAANLIGFAGQELGRKIPYKAVGVIVETTFGSVVEIVLFMVLLKKSVGNSNVPVIQAAILGSILANLLLCLGTCFIAGGLRREEQSFHPGISEAGSGLMLVAGMGLIIPAIFANALANDTRVIDLPGTTLKISRAAAVILLVAYLIFVFYQTKTHDTLFAEIYEIDEHKDADRHYDLAKEKLTFTECIVALTFAIAIVSLIAVFLVEQIHYIVQRGVSDAFVGLILVPLVEKFAEHLTEVDEAWDNQMNFAIAHVLGASIQTALLNTPLVIIVAWGLHIDMDMNFHLFDSVVLVLAILVVGSFLRDGKSNYLEGVLCVLVYMLIAISAWYYPNPQAEHGGGGGGGEHHRRGLVGQ